MSAITVTATYHTFIIQYFDAPSKQDFVIIIIEILLFVVIP